MALHRRLIGLTEVTTWIHAHRGARGISRFRQAAELAERATESVMETRLRLLLVLAGLPRPKVQVSLHDETGWFVGRPDLYYPGHRLAIEYDGATHRESLAADNRRQNRMLDAGYRLLRFTAVDVLQTPGEVVSLVRRTLAAV
jgi:very-short-patch-repair endonuclease